MSSTAIVGAERASTLLTSQVPVKGWHEVIGDPTLAERRSRRNARNAGGTRTGAERTSAEDDPGATTPAGKRQPSQTQREVLGAYAFKPGQNSQSGEVHRRGPDRLPRGIKLWGRMAVTALVMNDGRMMKALVGRLQRMVHAKSDFAFLRLCELLKDTLEPREKNGHAPERPPLAQIIVNGKPVMPAQSEPKDPGPDYEENGQAFTAVDVP